MKSDLLEFVRAAIKNPLEVSTVFPTSPALASRLLETVPLDASGAIAEIGAGTGAITRFLLPRMPDKAKYVGVEISPEMVAYLRGAYPGAKFVEGSAEGLSEIVGSERAAAVVSSLPWTIFSPELQARILESVRASLAPDGVFVTYVCINSAWYPQARRLASLLRRAFKSVQKSPVEWRNIPPAFVYSCRSPRAEDLTAL